MGTTLALDLGTSTGWAMRTADGRITSGTHSFKLGRFEGGGMRFLRFRCWLTELQASADGIGEVHFDEVRRHADVDAAHAYGGFLATLTSRCEHHSIPYSRTPVGAIKKHAAGKGNAEKAAMVAAMRTKGFNPADDNGADALVLLMLAIESAGQGELEARIGAAESVGGNPVSPGTRSALSAVSRRPQAHLASKGTAVT